MKGTTRAIHIFPVFRDADWITRTRDKYDPLAKLIPPHITLVFPFTSEISTDDITRHVRSAVSGLYPFSVTLQGVTGSSREYIWLNVKKGNDNIIALHDRLYTGVLLPHLSSDVPYIPHVTLGRFSDPDLYRRSLRDLRGTTASWTSNISQVVIETILDDETSLVEGVVPLHQTQNPYACAVPEVMIREAVIDDIPDITRLLSVLGYETEVDRVRHRLQEMFDDSRYHTLLALYKGRPVGLVGMEIGWAYELDDRYLRLLALSVDATAEGNGIGQALVRAAEQWGMDHGVRSVIVSSGNRPERVRAHQFYQRAGYEIKGTSFRKILR